MTKRKKNNKKVLKKCVKKAPLSGQKNPLDIQEVYNLAINFHQKGELQQAKELYRKVLAVHPENPDILHLLGLIAFQETRYSLAIEMISQAIEKDPSKPNYYNNLGLALTESKSLEEAKRCYQKALELHPMFAEAHCNLGLLLKQENKIEQSIRAFEKSIQINPNNARVHNALGTVLQKQHRFESALKCYKQALSLDTVYSEAYNNSCTVLLELGQLEEALLFCSRAIELKPDYDQAYYNLGNILKKQGHLVEAVKAYTSALEINSRSIDTYNNLGIVMQMQGKLDDAIAIFQKAINLNPDNAVPYNNIGNTYKEKGNYDEAIRFYKKSININPDFSEAYNSTGVVLYSQGQLQEATVFFQKAIQLLPDFAMAYNNLGSVYFEQAKHDAAVSCYRRAVECKKYFAEAYSNLLFIVSTLAIYTPDETLSLHRNWSVNSKPVTPLKPRVIGNQEKRLRVGYVSPDFRTHAVSYFIEPILENHDKKKLEIYCYAEVLRPDDTTERLKAKVEHWRSTIGLSDEAVAKMINDDEIDILVDLAGHTAKNRIRIFAYKAAPIQVTYLGYYTGTGLSTMDYWITDQVTTPGNSVEKVQEEILPLSRCWICFKPPADAPLKTNRNYNKVITFGSFNSLTKVTPEVVAVWSKILKAVPYSRLLLKTKQFSCSETKQQVIGQFLQHGVIAEQLELLASSKSLEEHLDLYRRVDIGLDTFPLTGGTTTAEALWMGTPVITLCGNRHIERMSTSMLLSVGLDELISDSTNEYFDIAVALANDEQRLKKYHQEIRSKMASSPFTDGASMALALEDAFRYMWQQYCLNNK